MRCHCSKRSAGADEGRVNVLAMPSASDRVVGRRHPIDCGRASMDANTTRERDVAGAVVAVRAHSDTPETGG